MSDSGVYKDIFYCQLLCVLFFFAWGGLALKKGVEAGRKFWIFKNLKEDQSEPSQAFFIPKRNHVKTQTLNEI